MNNKIEQLKELYKDIVKEIVETIEDDVVQIFQEYENGETDYFTYFIGSEQYNVKHVYATMDINDKQKIWLEFIVDLVTVDAEGNIETIEMEHSLGEIPLESAIELLKYVYNLTVGAKE